MSNISEEILSCMTDTNSVADDILTHYGMPRRSGRYAWGSGDDPYQRTGDFLSRVDELKKKGLSEKEIANELGMSTTQLRAQKAIAKDERRSYQVNTAKSLRDDGLGATEIGRKMGLPESTVRSLLNEQSEARMNIARKTADFIKEQVDKKGMIDVGKGVELELGITETKMKEALALLEMEGYNTFGGRIDQVTNPGQKTTIKVICPPDTPYKINEKGQKVSSAIYQLDKINTLNEYITRDGGETYEKKFTYPSSMDSKRLQIRYAEDGGVDRDGVIELRRGCEDLSLGKSHYAQVRILVDKTHYMKGMAVYSDDMPPGVDVIFNTNKTKDKAMVDVLKKIKDDPDNPFGSAIKDANQGGQYWYTDSKTGEKKLGLINKRADEGDWSEWADKLPSQFLSKQSKQMAEKQLGLAIADKKAEYDEIMSLTNPTIKKNLLQTFSDDCDSAAVHLKAAALPGQKYKVIVPINSLKDNEVYAPTYPEGTKLALVRYPHGGTFEIPVLTVTHRNQDGKKWIGATSEDGIGITKRNADRLSGADFDGDTAMCIPTHDPKGRVKITSTPSLKGLEGFEGKEVYGGEKRVNPDGSVDYYRSGKKYQLMTKRGTQTQMGIVSNLICDMTLKGASTDELAAAVRHSMVVIDAEKHKLDYKASEIDNNIAALKKKYQDGGGASTLISRASGEVTVDKRQGTPKINLKGKNWYDPSKPEGSLVYTRAEDIEYNTAKVYKRSSEPANGVIRVSKKGTKYVQFDDDPDNWMALDGKTNLEEGSRVYATVKTNTRTQKSTRMAETDDAYTLVSQTNTPMERVYAEYANTMKRMANQARLEMVNSGKIAYSSTAAKQYAEEVKSLNSKLSNSQINAPRERRAQLLANIEIQAKKQSNPNMTKEEIKKASQQALSKYRAEVGSVARRDRAIKITDSEWKAIQSGAISENKLMQILNHADKDELRQRATPHNTTTLSSAQVNRIKALANSNYTIAEIANKLGKSPATITKYLKGDR